jgi:hypothetical protein
MSAMDQHEGNESPLKPVDTDASGEPQSFSTPNNATAIRAEIEAVLLAEEGGLGDVWRRTQAGETPDEIRIARGVERPNFVWNYNRTARALLDGELPTAPTVALQTARTFRRILKENQFSPEARTELERRLTLLESHASDPSARADEDKHAIEKTVDAEERAVTGVYVYSLPHYVRHPYDEASGRTLLKVGHADRSVIRRFREQTRTTALPEDPVLLRVYVCDDNASTDIERTFHRLLEAADHDRSKARTGGTEWFLTSVRFLDEIAATLKLEVREVADLAEPLE